jgi:hypothetical protein
MLGYRLSPDFARMPRVVGPVEHRAADPHRQLASAPVRGSNQRDGHAVRRRKLAEKEGNEPQDGGRDLEAVHSQGRRQTQKYARPRIAQEDERGRGEDRQDTRLQDRAESD